MVRILLLAIVMLAGAFVDPAAAKIRFSDEDAFDPSVLRINEDAYLGKTVPDIAITDEEGRSRSLRDFADKPLILLLIYYDCPVMCSLLGEELAKGLGGVQDLTPEKDYGVLVLSFNEKDTAEGAKRFRRKLEAKHHKHLDWVFATARQEDISTLTTSVGYQYYEGAGGLFTHPNVYIFLSPEQKIMRYLFGIKADPFSLRLAVLESGRGKTGKFKLSSFVTFACFRYDSESREYVLSLPVLFGSGGVVMVFMTGMLLVVVSRKKKSLQVSGEGGNR
jgi:protein SCO1/2